MPAGDVLAVSANNGGLRAARRGSIRGRLQRVCDVSGPEHGRGAQPDTMVFFFQVSISQRIKLEWGSVV